MLLADEGVPALRGAVDAGFSRGFAAILDGQLTTAAAGYVLMQYGSGPIRGFAVMLLIASAPAHAGTATGLPHG